MLLIQWLSVSLMASAVGTQQPVANDASSAKITFEKPAAPLSRLMPDLAAATHMPLHVTRAIQDEVVLIDVRDVTVDELMKRMAQAVGGTWSQAKDGMYLGAEFSKRNLIQSKAFQARVAKLDKDLKQMSPEAQAAAQKKDGKPGSQEVMSMMGGGGTGDEVFYRLLSAIGAQQLATLEVGDRAVLSTRPTGKQFAMPEAGDWLSSYIARQNAAAAKAKAKAAAAKSADDGDDGGGDVMPDTASFSGPFNNYRNRGQGIEKQPSKVLLILERVAGMGSFMGSQDITCQLVLYDDKGNVIAEDRGGLGSGMDMEEMQAMMDEAQHKAKPTATEKPIELSADAKLLSGYLRSMNGGSGENAANAMSPERRAKAHDQITHPEIYDPLAYPADLLAGFGKAKNTQVVACLPDTFAVWLLALFVGNETPTALQRKFTNDGDLVSELSNGWLVISPASFKFEPMNRGDLKKVCDLMSTTRDPNIEQLSQLALTGIGDSARGTLGQLWLTIVDPNMGNLFSQDWDMLRLYGTLSPEQRLTLSQSKRLPISALMPEQRDLVDRMIYGSTNGMFFFGNTGRLSVENKPDQNSLLGPAQAAMEESMEEYGNDGNQPSDYRGEPTEAAPNGLPAGTAITFREVSTQVLEAEIKPKKGSEPATYNMLNQPMGVEQLASMVAMREQPQGAQMDAMMPKFDHVKIGTKRTMHFRIYVSAESYKPSRLSDCSFPEGSSYALNGLPGDLQKKFDAALKEMREAYKNSGAEGGGDDSGGGGGQPPK